MNFSKLAFAILLGSASFGTAQKAGKATTSLDAGKSGKATTGKAGKATTGKANKATNQPTSQPTSRPTDRPTGGRLRK